MFMISKIPFTSYSTIYYLKSNLILLIVSIIGVTPMVKNVFRYLKKTKFVQVVEFLEVVGCMVLLVLVTAFLIDASFNPFLYFRF